MSTNEDIANQRDDRGSVRVLSDAVGFTTRDYSADVFVSYGREDRRIAEAVVAALNTLQISVFWDDMLQGDSKKMLSANLESARCVLVLANNSLFSGRETDNWNTELYHAAERRKLAIGKLEVDANPPSSVTSQQAHDLSELRSLSDTELRAGRWTFEIEGWAKVLDDVGPRIGRPLHRDMGLSPTDRSSLGDYIRTHDSNILEKLKWCAPLSENEPLADDVRQQFYDHYKTALDARVVECRKRAKTIGSEASERVLRAAEEQETAFNAWIGKCLQGAVEDPPDYPEVQDLERMAQARSESLELENEELKTKLRITLIENQSLRERETIIDERVEDIKHALRQQAANESGRVVELISRLTDATRQAETAAGEIDVLKNTIEGQQKQLADVRAGLQASEKQRADAEAEAERLAGRLSDFMADRTKPALPHDLPPLVGKAVSEARENERLAYRAKTMAREKMRDVETSELVRSARRHRPDSGVLIPVLDPAGEPRVDIASVEWPATTFADEARYFGEVKGLAPDGAGVMVFPGSGDVYEGEWEGGQHHGYGVMTETAPTRPLHKDHGRRNAQSRFSWSGAWARGKPYGYGVLTLESGDVYEGAIHYESGAVIRHGFGLTYTAHGAILAGQWIDDRLDHDATGGDAAQDEAGP